MRSRGNDAFERGDYRTAAALYEAALRESPGDASIRKLLVESRVRVLRELAAKAEAARSAGKVEDAMVGTAELLTTQDAWKISGDEATGKKTVELVTWANAEIRREVSSLLAKRWPLAAERVLARRRSILDGRHFTQTYAALGANVQATGRASCSSAVSHATSETPYFARYAEKLCLHFGRALAELPPLPLSVSSVEVKTLVLGAGDEERKGLREAVTAALRKTPFWDDRSPGVARVDVQGRGARSVTNRRIELSRPWVEEVPYQAVETYQEPYEVRYQDYESYHEQEPYTDYQTVYRSCGSSRCPESVPVTRYRSVEKTRPVMRTKTEYRTRERTVTRIREVPRVFRFDAVESTGAYEAALYATLAMPAHMFSATYDANNEFRALDHDVSFPAADVSPTHEVLPPVRVWLSLQSGPFSAKVIAVASSSWKARQCDPASWSMEQAARCAWGVGLQTPNQAKAALAGGLGPEVDAVLSL